MFNDNLQQFAHQVGYISGLHTGGKLSDAEAIQKNRSALAGPPTAARSNSGLTHKEYAPMKDGDIVRLKQRLSQQVVTLKSIATALSLVLSTILPKLKF